MTEVVPVFKFDFRPFEQAVSRLPEKVAMSIFRKSMRSGLTLWKNMVTMLYSQHRSSINHGHLADHWKVVTRSKRSFAGMTMTGAVGVARGPNLPGWRLHFIEAGTKGGPDKRGRMRKPRQGKRYLGFVLDSTRPAIEASVRHQLEIELRKAGVS